LFTNAFVFTAEYVGALMVAQFQSNVAR